jgi:hypothetical protein
MYTTLLIIHSLVRWAVIAAGAIAVFRALRGVTAKNDWTAADDRAGLIYTITLDVQMLLGIVLYWLSPVTSAALQDMGAAMSVPTLRFWAVEHVTLMVLAIVLAHLGRVRIRKAPNAAARHRRAAVFFIVSLIAALAGTPWPGTANGRPWVRLS